MRFDSIDIENQMIAIMAKSGRKRAALAP